MTDSGFDKDLLMLTGRWQGLPATVPLDSGKVAQISRIGLGPGKAKNPLRNTKRPSALRSTAGRPCRLRSSNEPVFLYETGVIVRTGILLNYVGLTLDQRDLQSILFLDMTGAAWQRSCQGPWWGAIVALLSNSLVN